nr:MAG TPA_asm: hypothetical protein [Caudoviricetes sp.]
MGFFKPRISPRTARAIQTKNLSGCTLRNRLAVGAFLGPFSCATRFITKR